MKPYRPEVLEFSSDDGRQKLSIPTDGNPALQWNGETYNWPEIDNRHPKLGLFNVPKEQVLLIGGLGDPGMSLGDVYIHPLDGSCVSYIDLKTDIPKLEKMSSKWSEAGNFPWIAAVQFSEDGETLFLWICRKLKAAVNLSDFTVTTEKSTDDGDWTDGIEVYNKGMSK